MNAATTLPPVSVTPSGKNIEIKLRRVRLSFVDVFEPIQRTDDQGNKRDEFYLRCNILIDKNSPDGQAQVAAVRQALKDVRTLEWGENPPMIKPDCLCLQDGEPIDPNTADPDVPGSGTRVARWEGYDAHFYISANKAFPKTVKSMADAIAALKDKPPVQILGPRKTAQDSQGKPCFPQLTERDGLIYSGVWANVIIMLYPYNGTGKGANGGNHPHRLNASLEAIQFKEHGQPFGGKRVDAQNAFDEEEEGDEDIGTAPTQNAGAPANAADDLLG